MGRYRAIFDGQGKKAEFEGDVCVWVRPGAYENSKASSLSAPMVIRDIEPYRSMITGERIAGRRQHRDHLRAHGCIEVGNDTSHMKSKPEPVKSSRKKLLHQMLADKSDRQVQAMVKQEIKNRNV